MFWSRKASWNRDAVLVTVAVLLTIGIGNAKADYFFGAPTNLGPNVNSGATDWSPSISSDGLELYFESDRSGGLGSEDLWVSTRATTEDDWEVSVNLGPTVNSGAGDWGPSISGNGLELYFSSNRAGGSGGQDLWVSRRATTDESWGAPANLGSTVNGSNDDIYPCISSDGLELYFNCSRDWGLYVTRRATTDEPWDTPVLVPGYMIWPGISADGRVLLFGAEVSGGYGSNDIWTRTRATTKDGWDTPVNLGPTVNAPSWDCEPSLSQDGRTLYFTSNRDGGVGGWDTWQAPIIPIVDFNGDGTADSEDKSILMDHCGQNEPLCDIGPMPWGDGIVDIQDLWVLTEYVDVKDVVTVHTPSLHAANVPHDVTLQWLPAEIADTHDLYLGTSFEDVYAANRDDPRDVLVSQDQSVNTFAVGQLAFGQTYYWRIDEVIATFEPTIYEGLVVDFTTEPLAYPLDDVSATASMSDAGAGPENTVNRSGLSADDTHSTAATDMWLASGNGVDPVWIQYEFDKVYRLHEMLVWNYNVQFELVLGFGLKDVTVEYSENGTDWTVLGDVEFSQATATAAYTPNTTVDLDGVAAKYVRLTVNSGWGMMGKFGLSEVRFLRIPTRAREPQPVNGETGIGPYTVLQWRPGREAVAYEVYLSTDRQAVIDGTALVDTVTENSYLPGPLDPGQTYYWKINEVDDAEATSVWEGDVWKFTTAE